MTEATNAIKSQVDLLGVGSEIAGKFRLEQLIGEGGQAYVWRARHLELDITVALKILRFSNADRTQTERLRKEARAVARINHPAIVRVFDLGETPQGNPYFAMEHLDGESLGDALARKGKMSAIEAVQLLLPVASAIAAVHAVGVAHRDVKPDNVFIARSAHAVQPKLIDFGVAKHDVRKGRQHKLTEVGAVLGSPAYLSPEQARGLTTVDEKTDIWSFCVVLYECVTGAVPFRADNTHALLFSIAEDAPPSLADHGLEEPELWRILRRGLDKTPHDRWPSIRVLGRALAQWLTDRGVTCDVTGTLLEHQWLNPELVTPPPLGANAAGPSSSEAPAWTKRADDASHVTYRIGSPRPSSQAVTQSRTSHRGFIASMAFLLGMVASAFVLTHTLRGEQLTNGLLGQDGTPLPMAVPLTRLRSAPHRLAYDRLVKENDARLPALPAFLLPTAAVPVEDLRLVSRRAQPSHVSPAPRRGGANESPEIPIVVLESNAPTLPGTASSR